MVSELIAKVGKPFNEEKKRKKKFVQQRCCRQTTWQSGIIHYQVTSMNKGRSFTASSVALDGSTDKTDNVQQFSSEVLMTSLR